MNIQNFKKPTEHPWGMLGNHEKESFMAWFLLQCFEANDIDIEIQTKNNHDGLVQEGLLEKTVERCYKLTIKGKGLLYAYYGNEIAT